MNIEELVAGLKEQGLSDQEIIATLEQVKADIDAFLNGQTGEQTPAEQPNDVAETDEEKQQRVFGV